MTYTEDNLIKGLCSEAWPTVESTIPDGLIDMSHLIRILRFVTFDGRALNSAEPYGRADFASRMARRTKDIREEIWSRADAAAAMTLAILLLIDGQPHASNDKCPEEFLMEVFNQTTLTHLEDEFRATPYVLDGNGDIVPLLRSHEIFFRHSAITETMVRGCVRRHMTPHLPHLYRDEDDSERLADTEESTYGEDSQLGYEIVDMSTIDFDSHESDPLEGFDEFWEFFDQEVCPRYKDGADLSDLLDPDWTPDDE